MNRKTGVGLLCMLCCVIATTLFPPVLEAQGQGTRLLGRSITGTVYFMSGRATGRSLPFTLIINRITSPEEVQRLNSVLQSGGQDELLRAVSGMDAGRIQIGTGVGITANVIMQTPSERGTKLTVLYQRNLSFSELRYGTRSEDYKFGYAELYIDQGSNEGMLIPAARVRLRDGNTWEVEDFGTFPARLMGLMVRGGGGRRPR